MQKARLKASNEKDAPTCAFLSTSSGLLLHSLHSLHAALEKKLDNVFTQKSSISLSQYLVLVGFSYHSNTLSQSQLASSLRLTEATISRHIKILETKKILTRKKLGTNKKTNEISITPLGQKLFSEAEALLIKEIDSYFGSIKDKDRLVLSKKLTKITEELENN